MITPEEILNATDLEVNDVVIDILNRAAERIEELEAEVKTSKEDVWEKVFSYFGRDYEDDIRKA